MNFELFNLGPYSVGYPPETKKSIRVIYKVTEDDRDELTYKVLEFGKKPPLAQNEAW